MLGDARKNDGEFYGRSLMVMKKLGANCIAPSFGSIIKFNQFLNKTINNTYLYIGCLLKGF